MSEQFQTTHLFDLVTNEKGEIQVPKDKKLGEMNGTELLGLLGAFKNIYFPEFWYQKVKHFINVTSELDLYESSTSFDVASKISVFLNMKKLMEKAGFTLIKECLFDDDIVTRVITAQFTIDKKTHEYITNGFQFYQGADFNVVLRYDNDFLNIFAHIDNKEKVDKLVKSIQEYGKKNSVLKNRVIRIDGTILPINKKYEWKDIVIADNIRQTIEDNVTDFFSKLEVYKKNKIALKRGIILHGDPGTGKTLIGKILACQTKCTFMWVTSQDVMNYDIRAVFQLARKLSPTIIFLEDMDFYAAKRGENGAKQILGELLAQLDGFEENHGVICIGTTNDIKVIDKAIADRPSRFDQIIEIGKPDAALRAKMLERKFNNHNCIDLNFKELANQTKDFSGSHCEELVTLSVIEAVKTGSVDDKQKVIIKNEHVKAAIEKVKVQKAKPSMGFEFGGNGFDDDDNGLSID